MVGPIPFYLLMLGVPWYRVIQIMDLFREKLTDTLPREAKDRHRATKPILVGVWVFGKWIPGTVKKNVL